MADNPWKKHCFVSAARHPLDIMASAPGMKKLKPIMSVVHCCLRGDNDEGAERRGELLHVRPPAPGARPTIMMGSCAGGVPAPE